MAKKKGVKEKVDFLDPEVLAIAEGLARDGLDNKDIAKNFGYGANTFSTKVNSISELKEALKRGRKPLNFNVENSLYKRAMGACTTKTIVKRYIEEECGCGGIEGCPKCGGSGKILLTDKAIVQETITQLPPDVGAMALWLKQKKPEVWNKQPVRIDHTSAGDGFKFEIIDKTGMIQ